MDWIGAILESIREMECPCCGARLASCAVKGVTAEAEALIVRLGCRVCGETSVAVVQRDGSQTAPITRDDVLDAHEFLRTWSGPVEALLAHRSPKAA